MFYDLSYPQSKNFIYLSTEQGLPTNFINCVYQDKLGFIWIGSDDGLIRYDGASYKIYKHNPSDKNSISANGVVSILEDSKSNFFIGTLGGGVNKFDRLNNKFFHYQNIPTDINSLHDNNINGIFEDKQNNIWFSTWLGASRFNAAKNSFQNFFKYDSCYTNKFMRATLDFIKQHKPIASLLNLGDNEFKKKDFSVGEKRSFVVVGLGEIVGVDCFDYGWIEDAKGKIIWSMRDKNNFFAGGDVKNRLVIQFVTLDKGNYTLKYTSDISHSVKKWNALPPKYESLWGIQLLNVSDDFEKKITSQNNCFNITGLSDQSINKIIQSDDDTYWIATNNGLTKLNTILNKFDNYYFSKSTLSANHCNSIIFYDKENILTASQAGLFFFNIKTERFQNIAFVEKFLENVNVTDILVTSNKKIWVTTIGKGIFEIDLSAQIISNYIVDSNNSNGLFTNNYKRLFQDNAGSLWFVTLNEGIAVLHATHNNFNVYQNNPANSKSLPFNFINYGMEDSQSNIWLGSNGYGLIKYNKLKNEFAKINLNRNAKVIHSIFEDFNKNIWISSDKGLFQFKSKQKTINTIQLPNSLTNKNRINAIGETKDGVKWIGIEDQLISYDELTNTFNTFALKPDSVSVIINFNITDILITNDDEVWVTSSGGLFYFDKHKRKLERYLIARDVVAANNIVSIIEEDYSHFLLAAGRNGLIRFNKITKVIEKINLSTTQHKANVLSLLKDDLGYIWIGTDEGLIRFNSKSKTINHYYIEDGLPSDFFVNNAAWKTRDNNFFFATKNGLLFFSPQSVKINNYPPPIILSGLTIMNKEIDLKSNISLTNRVELESDQNVFSLKFAALNYIKSENNQYAYKLEGFDEDWILMGTRREISYTNLSSGTYRLKVKASNNDGVWNNKGIDVLIKVLPPWYKTWWAIVLYITILGLLYLAIRRNELKTIRLRNDLQLKQIESQKLLETDIMKSVFFTNISHEFRTPLTLIIEPLNQLKEKIKDTEILKVLALIERNSNRLLHLINQIFEISKLESGGIKLKVAKNDIILFIRWLVQNFESVAKSQNIELKFISTLNEFNILFDEDKIQKILTNLISNALKFSNNDGRIIVSVEMINEKLFVTVEDNGIGIPKEKIIFIFDRFYQVDDSIRRQAEGSGIGLSLVKELVDLHRGQIIVESKLGVGTKFTFWIPVNDDVYKTDEIVEKKISTKNSIKEINFGKTESYNNDFLRNENKPSVLVVDDNKDMRSFITSLIETEYNVSEAPNGEVGFKEATEIIPDLIICDVMMPVMDGYEFCEKIKNNETTNHIPIIILTAKAAIENRITGLDLGADDYLIKPFNKTELLTRMKNLISIRKVLQDKINKAIVSGDQFNFSSKPMLTLLEKSFIEKVKNIVENNFTSVDFDLEKFSEEIGMSQSQLRRKMNSLFNKSPNEFIRYYRLHKAAQKIRVEGVSVSEAAYSVGFNSLPYFSKCFSDEFGHSPSSIIKTTDNN